MQTAYLKDSSHEYSHGWEGAPSAADASTPIKIRYHSGALALTTRHSEGSGRA